ncbi:class I SAM-dependent methyltransferase [Streptomyces sp. WI04-05B]|uniref:class I SAM-dependent methyltransferase n=1 Tax=Streptomyces TaxID=1883 RepID=UPI0029AEA2E4|nr:MULTISPECIES: class I SAM-dependent methyltransferase [unclassified Streptomyces]MDX2546293.1 class I SAM-dependent methyltransferase [Streptomyces sp. WI04-05B]MDX2589254.1 class I SAM-dependent methyltransferase [Streptomyces sp. WI04-05A]
MAAEYRADGLRSDDDAGTVDTDRLAASRALWDDLGEFHGTDPDDRFHDVEAFLAGGQTLRGIERELAGDVTGKELLHLPCHFGMDTLNRARPGARVTGVDSSPEAITQARRLAERAGLEAEFVEADVQRLPDALAARFDLVVATYGVLSWIGDLDAWMNGAASAGLVVERLGEHTETETGRRHILPQGPDGLYRFAFSDTCLPILYSLRAVRPSALDGA